MVNSGAVAHKKRFESQNERPTVQSADEAQFEVGPTMSIDTPAVD